MLHALAVLTLLASPAAADPALDARVDRVLARTPLVDGHNDWPWALRQAAKGGDPLARDLDQAPAFHTDLTRLKSGRVGAQFWSVYVPASLAGPAAVQATLEQVALVRRLAALRPDRLELARTAADVRRIHKSGRVASLIGIEGGHSINGSLDALRAFAALGVGYMTLTHSANTPWVESATDAPMPEPLTAFGRDVLAEMNRLNILVDLSHVSPAAMRAAIAAAQAPVIFSHSSARALVDHPRNVPDDVLRLLPANGGVVMVTFVPAFVDAARFRWQAARAAEEARLKALTPGQPVDLAPWEAANPRPVTTLATVADHVDHVRRIAGVDHVGIGGDYDGIPDLPPELDGVEDYPALFVELARRGWTDAELAKLAGGNVLRVMERAEAVATAYTSRGSPRSTAR